MAMNQAAEYLGGIHYKVRMFAIPVGEPVFIYGDNQLVLVNALALYSTIKRKSQSIAFRFICKVCTTDEWRTAYIHTSLNVSDLMKKPLPGENRWRFVRMLLHQIFCGSRISTGVLMGME